MSAELAIYPLLAIQTHPCRYKLNVLYCHQLFMPQPHSWFTTLLRTYDTGFLEGGSGSGGLLQYSMCCTSCQASTLALVMQNIVEALYERL